MITITDKARERLFQLRKEEGHSDHHNVRVSVKGGGCSGLMYDLGLCGNVRITRGKNQLNGACAEINLKTGNSRLIGDGRRVKGLITPDK